MSTIPLRIRFDHGLGDCVYFARLAQLYRRRGFELQVHYEANKRLIWEAAGIGYGEREHCVHHPWLHTTDFNQPQALGRCSSNKIGGNLNAAPLPPIGAVEALWDELCGVDLTDALNANIQPEEQREADAFVRDLPRPIVLLHTVGTNSAGEKNLPRDATLDLYRTLLAQSDGTLVLLDWDDRVPRLAHARVRHLLRDWGPVGLGSLAALINRAQLLIGVDSGPYHFASLTRTPCLGLFLGHYPWSVTLPRGETANLTRGGDARRGLNLPRRRAWNLLEYGGEVPRGEDIGRHAARMLAGPRYGLPLGQDAMLQQWVRDWSAVSTPLSGVTDRDRTLDILLKECARRFADPILIETGCIRSQEDWSAGYATYVFAAFLAGLGRGGLTSIDINAGHIAFAHQQLAQWHDRVSLVCADSVEWLRARRAPIDVLYLDSMDTDHAECAQHALRELQAAEDKLSPHAIVVFDDSPWDGGWIGTGAKGVSYLLSRGWHLIGAGYQAMLSREPVTQR